jgi:hypothetical protein
MSKTKSAAKKIAAKAGLEVAGNGGGWIFAKHPNGRQETLEQGWDAACWRLARRYPGFAREVLAPEVLAAPRSRFAYTLNTTAT